MDFCFKVNLRKDFTVTLCAQNVAHSLSKLSLHSDITNENGKIFLKLAVGLRYLKQKGKNICIGVGIYGQRTETDQ